MFFVRGIMPKQGQNYFSYLLRAWRDHEGADWRFSLQEISGERRLHFSNLASLAEFLNNLVQRTDIEIMGEIDKQEPNENK